MDSSKLAILVVIAIIVIAALALLWGSGQGTGTQTTTPTTTPAKPPVKPPKPTKTPRTQSGVTKPVKTRTQTTTEHTALLSGEYEVVSSGEKVEILVSVPDDWNGRCVILVHGLGADKTKWIKQSVVSDLNGVGFCTVVFDLPYHGERGKMKSLELFPKVLEEGSSNLVDIASWLRSKGVSEVYAIGRSLGSLVLAVSLGKGAPIGKVELLLTGANLTYMFEHSVLAKDETARKEMSWVYTDVVKEIDPLYSLPKFKGSAHLHCGTKDNVVPSEACRFAYDALVSARERKIFWHDVGHTMPKDLFIDEAISFFSGSQASVKPTGGISPMHVLFVLHFDPPGGSFRLSGEACLRNYETSREELKWLLKFADSYGVKLTALFNGFYPQLALRKGELDPLRELAEKHEIGTHAHSLCYDESKEEWYRCGKPERWFSDAKRFVDEVLKVVGGENRVMCAMFERGHYGEEDQLMRKYGFTVGLGNRPEIALNYLGHIVWNPWRAKCSNDYGHSLEWDPSVSFVSIDHRAQIGSVTSHGGVDSRSDTLKRQFLLSFVEWKVNELEGDDRVWSWGVVHHPNYGSRYNADIEDFFGWLNEHFIGKTTPRGDLIAKYATASEVADAFISWERSHPGEPSFSYVEGDPYPYKCAYAKDKLLNSVYAGEVRLGDKIQAFKFSSDGGEFILVWYEGSNSVLVDVSSIMGKGKVRVITPTGGISVHDASSVPLSELPVFIERS